MRLILTMSVVAATLSACGGGDSADDSRVSVYKSSGSIQCGSSGLSLTEMQIQLAAANVQVHAAACGTDGMMQAALCGMRDGRLGIFQIPAAQLPAAASAGFEPLSKLPEAKTVPCV